MQRKPGFPNANCNIKMPDSMPSSEGVLDKEELQQRCQQLINFGHSQWGFNHWSWAVTKQDLDFVEISNGKYSAGVAAFVSVTVNSLGIHRENVGYATLLAPHKGAAIHNARKCAVTNALRETLMSFGGNVSTQLVELLDAHRPDIPNENQNQNVVLKPVPNQNLIQKPDQNQKPVPPEPVKENNENIANTNKQEESNVLKVKLEEVKVPTSPLKNVSIPPVAKTLPVLANRPKPTANVHAKAQQLPPPASINAPVRPNANVSFLLQPAMGRAPMYANPRPPLAHPPGLPHAQPPRLAHPMYPVPFPCSGPWFPYDAFDRSHGTVNLNFNMPPKNVVVNGRAGSVDCRGREEHGCWTKPSIFYDGFWTEEKVKEWVAEQVEKQFPGDAGRRHPPVDPYHAPNYW